MSRLDPATRYRYRFYIGLEGGYDKNMFDRVFNKFLTALLNPVAPNQEENKQENVQQMCVIVQPGHETLSYYPWITNQSERCSPSLKDHSCFHIT